MWYHFAFVAVSLAMLGLAGGAILVAIRPGWFPAARDPERLAGLAAWFAASIPVALAIHLAIPLAPEASAAHLFRFTGAMLVMTLPFLLSGICIALALTRSPGGAGIVYAADLLGAAAGGLLAPLLLPGLGGPGTAVAAAVLAALGAVSFAAQSRGRDARNGALAVGMAVVVLLIAQASGERRGAPPLGVRWVKGLQEGPALLIRWNSHSRIRIDGDPVHPTPPFGWGFSPKLPASLRVRQLSLRIDGSASTVLTGFSGRMSDASFLRYDATAVVHRLRPGVPVAVIGAGGGRDALAALAMDQPHVTAIEINGAILDAVHGPFGAFTGHLDRRPDLRWVHAEGRSFLAGTELRFGVIQLSLVDTWAASAAGALALAEHSLYTVEAWALFLNRLRPGGVVSCSRYYRADAPAEIFRLTALAAAALKRVGAADPRAHLMLLRETPAPGSGRDSASGVGTLLASRDPFSYADIRRLRTIAKELGFRVALDRRFAADPILSRIANGEPSAAFPGLVLDPPTDDRPYFFFYGRASDLLTRWFWTPRLEPSAPQVLAWTSAVLAVLGLLLVAGPALRPGAWRRAAPPAVSGYFACIGAGFMLAEIAWLERLAPFLGAPVYALVIVLCGLLLATGAGSWTARRWSTGRTRRALSVLPAAVVIAGLVAGPVIAALPAAGLTVRILVALLLVLPPGLLMGLPFAVGMRAAARVGASPAWGWAVNGVASVAGSAAAYLICLMAGIPAAFAASGLCYLAAVIVLPRER